MDTYSSGSVLLTADGAVGTSGRSARVYSIHAISGATPAVVALKNGTSTGGTTWVALTCVASVGNTFDFGAYGIVFPNGCFVDFDANTTSVVVNYCQ